MNKSKSSKASQNKESGNSKDCEDDYPRKHRYTVGDVQISTVDAFQGMEKNIIILSCCRTNGLGFLFSPNRLNVALTRARHHLIVIGKASNLRSNPLWKNLLSNAASVSGSYILTPQSGSEVVIGSLREHISRKNGGHIENVVQKPIKEQVNANKTSDVYILDSHQTQFNNEEQGTIQNGDAFHASDLLQGISGEDDFSHLCVNNKEIDMNGIVEGESASAVNNCHGDLQRIYVGGSQTEHTDGRECDRVNEDCSDFKCGKAMKFVLDETYADLLETGHTTDFNAACVETFDRGDLSGIKQAEGDLKPMYGSAVYASEHGPNDFGRVAEDEAKDCYSDVVGDKCNADDAPTFNLGFFTS